MREKVISPRSAGEEYLGLIEVPVVSFGGGYVKLARPTQEVFRPEVYDPNNPNRSDLPTITPGYSTFDLQIKGLNGEIIRTNRVQVTKVIRYDYDTSSSKVFLHFEYEVIFDVNDMDMVDVVEPVISHILPIMDRYLFLFIEGSKSACDSAIKKYGIINHSNIFYYQYKATELEICIGVDSSGNQNMLHLATIIWMFEKDIQPPELEEGMINKILTGYISKLYPVNKDDLK